MISLSFDRSGMAVPLPTLTITETPPADGFWIETLGEPEFEERLTFAPDSDVIPGSQLKSAVVGMGRLPAVIYATAATSAALQIRKDELAAALWQFTYDLTRTVDGVATTYDAMPTLARWSADDGMVRAHLASTALSIPVNPPGA